MREINPVITGTAGIRDPLVPTTGLYVHIPGQRIWPLRRGRVRMDTRGEPRKHFRSRQKVKAETPGAIGETQGQ